MWFAFFLQRITISSHPETNVLDSRYQTSAFGFQQKTIKTMTWLIADR
jgi:hypothetical protein